MIDLFSGLPFGWAVPLWIGFAVIVAMFLWTTLLFVRGRRARAHAPDAPADGADAFLWVFLVPALNEEVTIRDSVERLLGVEATRRRIVVIDDGSDDGTPDVLASIDHPDLVVLRRDAPDAHVGKAAALNDAYGRLDAIIGDTPRDQVIVCVIDADGRLHPDAPRFVAAQFADPAVGGVQSLVRIYNRQRPLTWMQDLEFSVYGNLFQAGRNGWGTAGMGGNGQFNRLRALDDLTDSSGPWRDRLTEDQDLGLRLIGAGWQGRQELRCVVDQQGLSDLRKLLRQRTRWSQGNLQAIGLLSTVWRAPLGLAPRIEQSAYLLMPFWQALVGLSLVVGVILAATGRAAFWSGGPTYELLFIYVLGFGGTIMGCVSARGWLRGLLAAQVYAFYSWLLWPVLIRSSLRQLTERRDWAKTEREALDPAPVSR
ncbi:MAG: glycosyltransferase family 2 protein [Solirubrobacteraceae bacterium]|nr:glycosyltransferase family 2 protein [Solirubrobacteraceae bacterium]